jgi:alanine racemase
MLGVANLEEAQAIRHADCEKAILVLQGYRCQADLLFAENQRIYFVVHSDWQLDLLEKTVLKNPLLIWVEVDSGMGRLGFMPSQLVSVLNRLQALSGVQVMALMSHFACADDFSHPHNQKQLTLFKEVTKAYPYAKSMAASAAIFNFPESHFDWVRPGLALYGVSPFLNRDAFDLGLKPVMTLSSSILCIKTVPAGHAVGYGSTFVCQRKTRLGIVAIGYADGFPRDFKETCYVLVGGIRVPVVGRVSMDLMAVDLTNCVTAIVGDRVILWGNQLLLENFVKATSTIAYTLLTGSRLRVHYQHVNT